MDRDAALHRSRQEFAVGDPLRGIAALSVVLGHVLGVAVLTWIIDRREHGGTPFFDAWSAPGDAISSLGTAGVSIFFVLSGYLLSRPFVRAAVLGDRPPGLGRFARNRILRIVPAFWAVLTLLVLTVLLTGLDDAGIGELLALYGFVAGGDRPLALWYGHTWTLDVEMQFYALLALVGSGVVLVLRGRGALAAAVVAALAAAIALWSFAAHRVSGLDIVSLGANVGRFMPGVLLAVAEASLRRPGAGPRVSAALLGGGIVALVAASVAGQDPTDPLGRWELAAISLGAAAVVAGPLLWQWSGGRPWRVLDNRFLHWAGTRSYAIYLVHLPVFVGLCTAFPDEGYRRRALLLAGAGIPLALAAAELLHRWVEVPFLRRRAPSQAAPDAPRDPAPI